MSKHLLKKDRQLFRELEYQAGYYAKEFSLPLKSVRPLEKENCEWYFGRCSKKGNMRIRVRDSKGGEWGERDEAYQIIDTLSHELAHLREQKHNDEWFSLHAAILGAMARDGVYDLLKSLI